jgi:hypothetical protein
MRIPDRVDLWDVLIVAAHGRASVLGLELERHLLGRGLKVKLALVSSRMPLPVPEEVGDDAGKAAYCVALAAADSEAHGGAERIAYALIPAPRFPGQVPTFAEIGAGPQKGGIDLGIVEDNIQGLAERLARRVKDARP